MTYIFFTFCTFLRADVTSEFPHCEIETVLFMYMSLNPVVVRVFDVITWVKIQTELVKYYIQKKWLDYIMT